MLLLWHIVKVVRRSVGGHFECSSMEERRSEVGYKNDRPDGGLRKGIGPPVPR